MNLTTFNLRRYEMHLTVFKTNVVTLQQAGNLQPMISALPPITHCNFDLDDCDNILRIISTDLEPQLVCDLLQQQGFNCEPMESFIYRQ